LPHRRCEAKPKQSRSATTTVFPTVDVVHNGRMTELLERAIERVRALSPEAQDDMARVLLSLAGDDEPVFTLTPEEEASFANSRAQAARREFATDEQVRAIWAKHGL
jgi:hypothetical protein